MAQVPERSIRRGTRANDPGNTRAGLLVATGSWLFLGLLDAHALSPGGVAGLYFTAGNGSDPARLYGVPD